MPIHDVLEFLHQFCRLSISIVKILHFIQELLGYVVHIETFSCTFASAVELNGLAGICLVLRIDWWQGWHFGSNRLREFR